MAGCTTLALDDAVAVFSSERRGLEIFRVHQFSLQESILLIDLPIAIDMVSAS